MENSDIQITHIPLSHITPSPLNPRKHFDEAAIKELAQSISVEGVLSPILVRQITKPKLGAAIGKFEIIAGERRYRACKTLPDMTTIPAIIREMNDDQVLEVMIVENLQRRDINPMEEAAGFQQLSLVKHMDAKEIGLRVGKSASYVAQRMKLNDLIEPLQKYFYSGRMLIKDAMSISSMTQTDQELFYEDKIDESDPDVLKLNDWTLREYQHKLINAPFDITDPSLDSVMGACTTCQFNTAANLLLFPEMASNPICQYAHCFKKKCESSYKLELVKAQEDPSVVLITGEYQPDKETQTIMKKLDGVLTHNQYSVMDKPDIPDREDFEGRNDTIAEDESDYQEALVEYEEEVKEYREKIESGRYLKAFILGGDNKGHYEYIHLNKSSKGTKAAATSTNGTATNYGATEIKSEIDRMIAREKRSKELDDVKVWEELRPLFMPAKALKCVHAATGVGLSEAEIEAFASAIDSKISYPQRAVFRKMFKDPGYIDIHRMIRFFIFDVVPAGAIFSKMKGDDLLMYNILSTYCPDEVAKISAAQKEKADKRAASVDRRIKALQAKLKELKSPPKKESSIKVLAATIIKNGSDTKPAAKKAVVKKGKGLKA